MNFTDERAEDGVTRRQFDLTVAGERVPAVVWAPEGARGPRPLVLMGHGGGQHKKITTLATRAARYARKFGYAVGAIDAPGHGDRVAREETAKIAASIGERMRSGVAWTPETMKTARDRANQAVPEWHAALDALQGLDFVGKGPVGYWGVSLGTMIGVPFVASEPRITCAVLGLAGLLTDFEAAAGRINIPVQFVFQWDDEVATREAGIALFDAFGSAEKTMHINPGVHVAIPNFEAEAWESFFVRHLGVAADRASARTAEAVGA
jgi:dienelactone hydrolase